VGAIADRTRVVSQLLNNHIHALALYFAIYNFRRIHKTLKVTPATADGVSDKLWSMDGIAERIEANRPQPGKRVLTTSEASNGCKPSARDTLRSGCGYPRRLD
jgi:hypothetical protein